MSVKTQLSVYTVRERLSEATIPKGIVGGFKYTVLQKISKNGTRGHGRVFASDIGKQQK